MRSADINIDVDLLRNQRNFLLAYPWVGGGMPEKIEGLINLLDHILDIEEGYGEFAESLREMQIELEVDERRTDLI